MELKAISLIDTVIYRCSWRTFRVVSSARVATHCEAFYGNLADWKSATALLEQHGLHEYPAIYTVTDVIV